MNNLSFNQKSKLELRIRDAMKLLFQIKMPSKRSRSQERERKRLYRSKLSEEVTRKIYKDEKLNFRNFYFEKHLQILWKII